MMVEEARWGTPFKLSGKVLKVGTGAGAPSMANKADLMVAVEGPK